MQLRGDGSMTKRQLLVVTYDNNVTKDGKTRYLDVQLDARDEHGAGQTNLHAVTKREKDKEGKDRYTNGAPYSVDQFEAIKAAAGDKHVVLPNGANVYSVQADLMPATRGNGLIINTKKEMSAGLDVDDKVIDNQFASVKQAKEAAAAAKAAEAEVQAEAPEAAVEVEQDEPQV